MMTLMMAVIISSMNVYMTVTSSALHRSTTLLINTQRNAPQLPASPINSPLIMLMLLFLALSGLNERDLLSSLQESQSYGLNQNEPLVQ